MFLAIPTQPTCARAWVAAASAISAAVDAYNVVIDVDNPTKFDDRESAVVALVDTFLRDRDLNPISTITNTIFPDALFRKYGTPKFYDEYHTQVYDKLTTVKWGLYFERLTRHQDGKGETYNPLQDTIDKLKTVKDSDHQYKSVYELAVYDPLVDRRYLRGGQCLSFLSFKMHPERGLTLTALYRNQTYIKQAGLEVGPLTCIATHAELDIGKGWGITDARKLVTDAAALLKG